MATGDIDRAARYLMAFVRAEDGPEAEAGAYLVADALVSLRSIEASNGEVKHVIDGVPAARPGL